MAHEGVRGNEFFVSFRALARRSLCAESHPPCQRKLSHDESCLVGLLFHGVRRHRHLRHATYRTPLTLATSPIWTTLAAPAPSTAVALVSAAGAPPGPAAPEKVATTDEAARADLVSFCCDSLTPSTENGPKACGGGGRGREPRPGPAVAARSEDRSLGSRRTLRPWGIHFST